MHRSTEATHSPDGSKTVSQMVRESEVWRDLQPQTTRCQHCPDWVFVGTAADAREAFAQHLRDVHPHVNPLTSKQRRNRMLQEAKQRRADMDAARVEQRAARAAEDRPAEADTGKRVRRVAAATPSRDAVGGARKTWTTRKRWTTETAIAAVQAFAAEHGRPPAMGDTLRNPALPPKTVGVRLYGSWGSLIEAAGFPRPTRATRYKTSSGSSRTVLGGSVSRLDEQQPDLGVAATADWERGRRRGHAGARSRTASAADRSAAARPRRRVIAPRGGRARASAVRQGSPPGALEARLDPDRRGDRLMRHRALRALTDEMLATLAQTGDQRPTN